MAIHGHLLPFSFYNMIVRNRHIGKVASLRDAREELIISHRTALRLCGVIKIKPLRGFFTHPAGVCTRLRGLFAHSVVVCSRLRGFFAHSAVVCTRLRGFFVHTSGVCSRLRGLFVHTTGVCTRLRGFFAHSAVVCSLLRGFFMANADNLLFLNNSWPISGDSC